jgi:hypothetical protein
VACRGIGEGALIVAYATAFEGRYGGASSIHSVNTVNTVNAVNAISTVFAVVA